MGEVLYVAAAVAFVAAAVFPRGWMVPLGLAAFAAAHVDLPEPAGPTNTTRQGSGRRITLFRLPEPAVYQS